MSKAQLRERGPLGLEPSEWKRYAVDGDEDGHIHRGDPADSAATLARLIWSRGGLRAGIFTHNQAAVVRAGGPRRGRSAGRQVRTSPRSTGRSRCRTRSIAPINWDNLTLSNELELQDITSGAIDPRIVGLIGAITQQHQLTISALRSDHSAVHDRRQRLQPLLRPGDGHRRGRRRLLHRHRGQRALRRARPARSPTCRPRLHPTELIYCFDVDGPGPAFARSDHCDHVHAARRLGERLSDGVPAAGRASGGPVRRPLRGEVAAAGGTPDSPPQPGNVGSKSPSERRLRCLLT